MVCSGGVLQSSWTERKGFFPTIFQGYTCRGSTVQHPESPGVDVDKVDEGSVQFFGECEENHGECSDAFCVFRGLFTYSWG